jgi:hypothetical protein
MASSSSLPCFPSASLLLSPSLPRRDQQGGWAPRPTWRVPFGRQARQGWRPQDRTGWSSPLPKSPVRGENRDKRPAFPSGSVRQCGQPERGLTIGPSSTACALQRRRKLYFASSRKGVYVASAGFFMPRSASAVLRVPVRDHHHRRSPGNFLICHSALFIQV